MLEVSRDDQVADFVPRCGRNLAGIKQLKIVVSRIIALDIIPVMVCPHEGEFHAGVVGYVEKTFVQRVIEIRPVVVIIPVEDKGIHPVIGGGGDFLRHDFGFRFILIAPDRRVGLDVPGKTRLGGFDLIPFRKAGIFIFVPAWVGVRAGIIVSRHGDGWVGQGGRIVRHGGIRFAGRHGNIIQRRRGLGGLEKDDNRRPGGNPLRHQHLFFAVSKLPARELILFAVQNGCLQDSFAIENVRDIKRQHDVGRFFQDADPLL